MVAAIRESTTLKLVVMSWLFVSGAFLYSWGYTGVPVSLTEYAGACTALFTIWIGREWRAAHYPKATP